MKKQPVVSCFLQYKDKILLLQKSKNAKAYKSRWAAVSSILEDNELPLYRAEREVADETGLIPPNAYLIRDGRPLSIKDNSTQWIVHPFLFSVRSPEAIKLNKGSIQYEWLTPTEIHKHDCAPGLYEAYRRVELPEQIDKKIEAIRTDKSSGSIELAKSAVDVLLSTSNSISTESPEEYFEQLNNIAWHLFRARPNMAPVQSEVVLILNRLKNSFTAKSTAQSLKLALKLYINQRRSEQRSIREKVQKNALPVLDKYKTLLAHSYSSSVVDILTKWANRNRRLFVTESRPLYEGHTVARLLSRVCDVTLITEAQVGHFMGQVDCALTGADSILADGSIVNKMGTYMVALAARDNKKPFYVIADTSKFHPGSAIGMDIPEETHDPGEVFAEQSTHIHASNIYFDSTPERLITGIFTEDGLVKGAAVRSSVQKAGKLVEIFQELGNYGGKKQRAK